MTSRTILQINASARHEGSASRELTSRLIAGMPGEPTVVERDLAAGLPLMSEDIMQAMWTPEADRTSAQQAALSVADELIRELVDADAVVVGLPIYNFGPPASLKAWADLVARAGTTFRYSEQGPVGLIDDKPVYVVVASGGVPVGAPVDHASTWLTTFLNFLGLRSVELIAADRLNVDPEAALDAARSRVDDAVSRVAAAV